MERDDILTLPNRVTSRTEVSRLNRELEVINDLLKERLLRSQKDGEKIPVSEPLTEVARANKLDLHQTVDRDRLARFLESLKTSAPDIHISFAAEAPPDFVEKIVAWLRKEVHPLILLDVGLQPNIAAGCIIRTTNKYIDCSVGQHLRANREKLVKLIHGATQPPPPPATKIEVKS